MARRSERHHRKAPRAEETIAGVHPVTEALAAGERIERVVVGAARANDPAIRTIVAAAKARGITVSLEGDDVFRRLGTEHHQHVAAIVTKYAYAPWEQVRAAVRASTDALVVALDHIEDPQNLGAVIRNAEGAGATAVVIPDRRSAGVTPAARRAAAGAASHMAVATVPNLAMAIDNLKADGCWVYGLSTDDGAATYTEVDMRGRCVIAVGAEGKGLSRVVALRCDRLAKIPLRGKVKSLNASSAAAIALFEALRQRAQGAIAQRRSKPPPPVNP